MDKVTAKYVFSNGNLTKVVVGEWVGLEITVLLAS
jgi:hypothetical protein